VAPLRESRFVRILHVDPEMRFGGGERQVLGLLRCLARAGHENLLAAPAGSMLAASLVPADAALQPLAVRNDLDLGAALRLWRLVERTRPDIVHFHTARAHALAFWLPRLSSRAIATRRMDYPLRRSWRTRLLYNRRVAAVVAISEEVRRRLLEAGVVPERVRVIPSGVEAPAALPDERVREAARRCLAAGAATVVATVASLERRKGIDVLLEALAILRRAGTEAVCLVCGDGTERLALQRRAEELGLERAVRFLGHRADVSEVLAAADVFALPSRHEGLGVAVLEAMAVGLPVVASSVGGIPEAVVDGVTGVLVPPEDPLLLAAALARCLEDPEAAREMGRRGRERVLERYSMEASARAYEVLYGQVLRGATLAPERR
jgi:glycosyltransferase involved in cell wall biosynthesis